MAQGVEVESRAHKVKVNTADTEELISLTRSLDELGTKLDRLGGIVVKLYQMTERLESRLGSGEITHNQSGLDESVVEWIHEKVAKKRKKELKKWRNKQKKK